MSDRAKCHGVDCPLRDHCRRYIEPVSEQQSYGDFKYDDTLGCEHFVETRKEV